MDGRRYGRRQAVSFPARFRYSDLVPVLCVPCLRPRTRKRRTENVKIIKIGTITRFGRCAHLHEGALLKSARRFIFLLYNLHLGTIGVLYRQSKEILECYINIGLISRRDLEERHIQRFLLLD